MRANTANAVVISLLLHGFIVGVIVLVTFFVAQQVKEAPVIFELVAGPATAPDELVAPALGNTTRQIKLEVPVVETVASMPAEPEPVVQTQPEEAAVEPPPAEMSKPKEIAKPKPAEKPAPKPKPSTSLTKELQKSQRMSYKDYIKKHPTPKPAPATTGTRKVATGPRIDATGIAAGVQGGSTANTRGGGGARP